MKKITIVIMTMLLVLAMGQAAMAKVDATVGLTLGYDTREYRYDTSSNNYRTHTPSALAIGISGNIYVMDRLSFALDGSMLFGVWNDFASSSSTLSNFKFGAFNVQTFARYDVLAGEKYKLGVQVGAIFDYLDLKYASSFNPEKNAAFFIAPGIYGEYEVLSRLKLSVDAKIPVYGMFERINISNGNIVDEGSYFLKLFLYDAKIGVSYEITPQINIGVEGKISNVNAYRLRWHFATENIHTTNNYTSKPAFNIGLKVGYKF